MSPEAESLSGAPSVFDKPTCIYMHADLLKLQIYNYANIMSHMKNTVLSISCGLKNA